MQFLDLLEKQDKKKNTKVFLSVQFRGVFGFLYESYMESFQQKEIPTKDREESIGFSFYHHVCDRFYDNVFLHHKKHFVKPGLAHEQHRLNLKLWAIGEPRKELGRSGVGGWEAHCSALSVVFWRKAPKEKLLNTNFSFFQTTNLLLKCNCNLSGWLLS